MLINVRHQHQHQQQPQHQPQQLPATSYQLAATSCHSPGHFCIDASGFSYSFSYSMRRKQCCCQQQTHKRRRQGELDTGLGTHPCSHLLPQRIDAFCWPFQCECEIVINFLVAAKYIYRFFHAIKLRFLSKIYLYIYIYRMPAKYVYKFNIQLADVATFCCIDNNESANAFKLNLVLHFVDFYCIFHLFLCI